MRSIQPLRGIRVLITRAAERAGELEQLLEQRGAVVRNVPLIRIGPPPNERALQTAVDEADGFDWLVFTSPNGVQSFSARRRAPLSPKVRVAAIGAATAEVLHEQLNISQVLQPARFVAESLADTLVKQAAPASSVLILQAADARPVLAARLRAAGMRLKTVVAYSTVSMPPADLALRIKDCDVITLASASAVRALVTGLGGDAHAAAQLRGKLIACIGPVTEHEVRVHGLHVELVPANASMQSMVDALCLYYSAHPA